MAIAPHIRRLRDAVGHDLLLIPSVAVLPRDNEGRLLMVRHRDYGQWGTIGGAVEVDESPNDAAVREAHEEAGVEVEVELRAALGGPGFRVSYPNGDQTAYVCIVYHATVVAGTPLADQDEILDVAWVRQEDLPGLDLTPFARATFDAVGL